MDKQAGEEETGTEIACIDRWMNIQQLLNEAEYHLKNYGDRGMCYRPRQLTPSGISIILQMIRKPNSKIVVLFSQNNSQFKKKLNNAYLRRCLVHVYREGQKIKQGHPTQFSEIICSEDDLKSRIFGTFVVKCLACLPLLGFSNS